MPARNLPACARWSLLFLASPACIFLPISPPAWPFRRCRWAISLHVHVRPCLSSTPRRAFFFPFLLRLGRLDAAGGDFVSFCTLASTFPPISGVHFSLGCHSALPISPLPAGILSPCARRPTPFLPSPACIFFPAVTPLCPSPLCRRRFCLLLHAGLRLFSHHRRGFFSRFLLRLTYFVSVGGDFVSFCTPAFTFLPIPGVHFFPGCHSALPISPLPTEILSPYARRPPPFFPSPACKMPRTSRGISI